jgi:hypothetical protein
LFPIPFILTYFSYSPFIFDLSISFSFQPTLASSKSSKELSNEDSDYLESQAEPALLESESESTVQDDDDDDAGGDDAEERPENPTYVLPYPPVLPGHYTPLFNPYTNVNPLSSPYASYAAQPGGHPAVASAAAASAAHLSAVSGMIAHSHAGLPGHPPYYPFAGKVSPFSGYAGWIHPANLNSAAVGDNTPDEFPQFVETSSSTQVTECEGCEY